MENKKQNENESQKAPLKVNRNTKIAIIVTSILCIAIAFIIVLNTVIIPKSKYNKAISLISNGQYDEAIVIFEELGDKELEREAILGSEKYSFLKNLNIGDTFKFGKIEQDNDENNGTEEIDWIVLDKKDGAILVISKYCIYTHAYYSTNEEEREKSNVKWATSDIRVWLNKDFYQESFSKVEQSLLNETKINYSTDFLFLLDTEEAEKYFTNNESRKTVATPYAQTFYYDFAVNSWRLRSEGGFTFNPSNVDENGMICKFGYAGSCPVGVRPAMWLAAE